MAESLAQSALVLFDIDGTLLRRSGPHHRQALVDAVRSVTGLETTTDHIPVQGMLDGDILAWMLGERGLNAAQVRLCMPMLVKRAQWLYARNCPADLTDRVCPGVTSLLTRLRERETQRGLVTGNFTQIGWKKMQRARLRHFFKFGAFAETGRTRGELVERALSIARSYGYRKGQPVTLIGDHANDIRAAKENGIAVVAVGTGMMPVEELATHSPDLVVPDLTALDVDFLFRRR